MRKFSRKDILEDTKVNNSNLQDLCNQIIEYNCYDKVGDDFYYVAEDMQSLGSQTDLSFERVSKFLNHLGSLKNTSTNVGYEG